MSKVKEFMCRTSFDSGFVKKYNPDARIHEHWEMLRSPFFNDLYSSEPEYLLHMGGTNPLKGVSNLLRAYDQVRQYSEIGLKLVGNTDPQIIEQIILHYDLQHIQPGDIEIIGMLSADALAETFRQCYALVHPSLIDNSPNSICEAQVAGLPVIASNVGGVASLIDDGNTGLLTSLEPADIAKAIIRLIRNADLQQHLSRNSRKEARVRHDPARIHDRTLNIYKTVIAA
jgi:glycosyltransferase involved in cell wall biosynthesis